jgi:acetolactate synthase-1/2/3 large subunit
VPDGHFLSIEAMPDNASTRSGGQILVDALKVQGTDMAFCVPGESYLAVLDALHDTQDTIRLVTCRQEGGAAFMAEAYGKLTGKPGICFVTRGPGATNASIGVHTAYQDSTPMILFVGQVGSDFVDREAFQEIDYRRMFGQMTKWVASIDSAQRIPEYVNRAFQIAMSGRPGPVVLALPEDMLTASATVRDTAPCQIAQPSASSKDLRTLRSLLCNAQRPLMILGGSGWTAEACRDIQRFAEAAGLPVATAFRRQDLFDNRHLNYAGNIGLGMSRQLTERVKQADLLLVVGARLGEATTNGYTLVDPIDARQTLVHVHAAAEELGILYQPALPINAAMPRFASQLAELEDIPCGPWRQWTLDSNREYLADIEPQAQPFDVDLALIVKGLAQALPQDAIITNGAGNYAGWVHRYFQYKPWRTQLAPTNGAMGYGVPAAVAAKLAAPKRTVVCFAGDGCFMMNGQELATAIQHDAAVIFIVVNNGVFGTIRMHQEMHYPERPSGTQLVNPDFAALARAYGAHGETVTSTQDFAAAFERARSSGKAALIEVRTDVRAVTSRRTLADLQASLPQ